MNAAACACVLATMPLASAFVSPSPLLGAQLSVRNARTSALAMQTGSEYAATLPGTPFNDGNMFDPLGLSQGAKPEQVKKWREAEVKHGRVAMLSVLGIIIQEVFHPLFLGGQDVGPAIYHFQQIQEQFPVFWLTALFIIGLFEADIISRGWEKTDPLVDKRVANLKSDYIPGDLNFDPLGFAPKSDPSKFREFQTKEINNGRLAMIASMGLLVQELVDKKGIIEHFSS